MIPTVMIPMTEEPGNTRQSTLSVPTPGSGSQETADRVTRVALKKGSTSRSDTMMIQKESTDVFFTAQKSALPSFAKQCTFEWHNLNVYVGNNDKTGKHILHNFNGCIQSGELLAVMGGSGAGKSTLLNALSGRTNLNEQSVTGYLSINGRKFHCCQQEIIKSICTYVPQSDILCATQTVEEALNFYARLKLSHLAAVKREKRVNYLIHVLHLESCRNNYIGDEKKRGISGGEKRRVSIASEILNDVDIIFLDEPTSGLDAYTAARTIKTLKQFCAVSNKIIIATIHQPSVEVFYLFDKLMLLSNGKLCFNSSVEPDVDIFFKQSLRPRTNPADVIVFQVQKNADQYAHKWEKSSLNLCKTDDIALRWDQYEAFQLTDLVEGDSTSIKTNGNMPPKRTQHALLLVREVKGLMRNKRLTVIRLLQLIFFALLCGLCYFDIREAFDQRARAFFLLILVVLLFGIVTLLTAFPKQKLLFEREYNSGTYNILSWSLTIMMIEVPREVLNMILFTAITYFMINLDGNIVHYWFTFFLASISGGSFGMLFGTVCKSTVEATQAVPAALLPLVIFADVLISIKNLPAFLHWIAAINPMYYLFRCLYIIEFDGVIYPRHLSDVEKEMCASYEAYAFNLTRNQTAYINDAIDTFIANNTIPPEFNLTVPSTNMSAGGIDIPHINNDDYYNINGNATNINNNNNNKYHNNNSYLIEQESVDAFCSAEVPYTWFFAKNNLDANALTRYWLIIVFICCVLRVVTVLILWMNNNNGMSWIYKKLRCIATCQCVSSKVEKAHAHKTSNHCRKHDRESEDRVSLTSPLALHATHLEPPTSPLEAIRTQSIEEENSNDDDDDEDGSDPERVTLVAGPYNINSVKL